MTTFLSDSFTTGSGSITGRTPETGYAGATWTNGWGEANGCDVTSGYVTSRNTADTYANGACSYADTLDYGAYGPVVVGFSFKSGPSLTPGATGHYGFSVEITVGTDQGSNFYLAQVRLPPSSTGWVLELSDSQTGGYITSGVTVSASTEYSGLLTITQDGAFLSMFGVDLAIAAVVVPTTGLGQVTLRVGSASAIGSITINSVASANLTAPTPTLAASGGFPVVEALLTCPLPAITAFSGAHTSLDGPSPALYATGHDSSGENNFAYTAPAPTLSARGGANSRLTASAPTLTASAAGTGWGSAALAAPASRVSASGTVSGTAQASLAPPVATLIGYGGAVCSITLTGKSKVLASGTAGSIGAAALTCPLFELTASGTAQNYGSAKLLAPAARLGATAQVWLMVPGAVLTAIGSATVVATYEAYAVNLNHNDPATNDEVTRYTNFPFTQIVRYQGSYFGVAADGLYLLEGTTDDSEPIPWAFKTAMTDFKSPFRKTVVSAYFGGRLGSAATIDLHVGEDGATTYNYSTVRSDHAQCYRQKFGRGLTAHYYALGVAGTGTLELDNIEFDTLNSTRRI